MYEDNGNNGQNRPTEQTNQTTQEAPRWQPNPEKYNTGYTSYTEPPRKKKSHTGIIVLIIVIVVLVAIIVAGLTIGSKYVNQIINKSTTQEITTEAEDVQDETIAETEGNTVVWSDVESETTADVSGVVVTDVTSVVDEVFPAVVSITSRTLINDSNYYGFFFGSQGSPFGGNNSEGTQREVESGLGSGTIIGQNDEELLILTSNHVVDGSSSLAVTFVNGTSIDGVIKAASDENDIAIVAVKLADIDEDTMSSIKTAKLSTTQAKMGEGVIVIGNPLGYGMSVTTGIVSAVDRELTVEGKTLTVLQTDAAINSGNSGGCMLNSKGEIIGISEAKITVSSVEGMCYAIPVLNYMDTIQELIDTETPEQEETITSGTQGNGAYLGIKGRDITSDIAQTYNMVEGVYVIDVASNGGAAQAGIQSGDIITAMDGTDTSTMSKLQFELANHNEGDVVTVTVMRAENGNYVQADISVTLTGQIS